jgi:hypothetical protein
MPSTKFIPAIMAKQPSQNTSVQRSPQYARGGETGAVFCGWTGGKVGCLVSVIAGIFGASVDCAVMTQLREPGCSKTTAAR